MKHIDRECEYCTEEDYGNIISIVDNNNDVCTINATVRAKTGLVRTYQYFKKYHFKNSVKTPALPW